MKTQLARLKLSGSLDYVQCMTTISARNRAGAGLGRTQGKCDPGPQSSTSDLTRTRGRMKSLPWYLLTFVPVCEFVKASVSYLRLTHPAQFALQRGGKRAIK